MNFFMHATECPAGQQPGLKYWKATFFGAFVYMLSEKNGIPLFVLGETSDFLERGMPRSYEPTLFQINTCLLLSPRLHGRICVSVSR